MFPNGWNGNGYWGPESFALGAAIFDWRGRYSDLPEEVREYLNEHEAEIHTAEDVGRLIDTYNLKK